MLSKPTTLSVQQQCDVADFASAGVGCGWRAMHEIIRELDAKLVASQVENAEHERCRRDMTARTLQLEAENRELRERLREHYYDAE